MPRGTGPGLSTAEAAREIGVTYARLWRWVKLGLIPGLESAGTGHPLRWQPGHIHAARLIKARMEWARLVPVQQERGARLTA
jgi:hypothetical protein